MLSYTGADCFRERVVCSTLSGRPARFEDIRVAEAVPGLREEEVLLLRIVEQISNGCVVELSPTGCLYRPGLLISDTVVAPSSSRRNVSYYLEPLLLLGLFGKQSLSVVLEGVTHDDMDLSVDVFRTVTLPLIAKLCGIEAGLELKVHRRGAAPDGGGKVELRVPVVRQLPCVRCCDEGMVKRIRGVAYALKVSPQFTNRMVEAARGLLNPYLADVYIFTDAVQGKESGNSPGYGLHLVAETTTGCLLASEGTTSKSNAATNPEDVGRVAAAKLLEEIQRGGVVDGHHQRLILFLCALGPALVNQVRVGALTPAAVSTLRLLHDVFGVVFSVKPEKEHGTVLLSCIGAELKNVARKAA